MKSHLKRALAWAGWSLNRVPSGIVVGFDLGRELRLVVGDLTAPVCIDAGAHDGHFVDFLREHLRKPSIHAFEPAPEPFARLKARHGGTPGVKLINAGLGSEAGKIEFN